MDRKILRIIDANLNRSREGLRVCEEIARFALNSPILTREFKDIRHSISDTAKRFIRTSDMIATSRDSAEDVGRASFLPREMRRAGLADILASNMARAEESLRVLEEFSKLINKRSAAKFCTLRFRVYDIERSVFRKIEAREKDA